MGELEVMEMVVRLVLAGEVVVETVVVEVVLVEAVVALEEVIEWL